MKRPLTIFFSLVLLLAAHRRAEAQSATTAVDFFGVSISLPANYKAATFSEALSEQTIRHYIGQLDTTSLRPFLAALLQYKEQYCPDDWLYYQLIRKVAEAIAPKKENYHRYTFYKWWFLTESGYDARLLVAGNYLLFYVQCDETVYNIPYRITNDKQFVCLNYHDYGSIDFDHYRFADVTPFTASAVRPFSYKVHRLPDFKPSDYTEKEVAFSDEQNNRFSFHIKVNPQVKSIFNNYPVVDYDLQFNMPLSKTTYESLIPSLKKEVRGLKPKDGVEFLMRFTRYAFLFKPDTEAFGSEKRLTAEQTLLSEYSDCEDRAALFFFLVKEIYQLPMLVLTYPNHVTVAVEFDKPYGKTIQYNGKQYSVCEPSPQTVDYRVGQLLPELRKQAYQVAYAYNPF